MPDKLGALSLVGKAMADADTSEAAKTSANEEDFIVATSKTAGEYDKQSLETWALIAV